MWTRYPPFCADAGAMPIKAKGPSRYGRSARPRAGGRRIAGCVLGSARQVQVIGGGPHGAHAYAVTIHRSQGGEYPAVVIRLPPARGRCCSATSLYTVITKATKLAVLVGSRRALAAAAASRIGRAGSRSPRLRTGMRCELSAWHAAPPIAGTSPTRADRQRRPRAAVGPSCRPSCPRRTPGYASRMSRPPGRRPRPPRRWWCGGPRQSVPHR
jgi:UvrD-like helicase C-terminal domain